VAVLEKKPENVIRTMPLIPSGSNDGADYGKQDIDLMALAGQLENGNAPDKTGADQVSTDQATPPLEMDIELYKRLVRPTCFLIAVVTDWCNRRFLKKSFRPLSEEQLDMVEPDLAVALKKTFDAMLPEIAKRNPEWFCLAITFVGIYAANTEALPEPKTEDGKEADKQTTAPAVSTVEV
jgi:hypothetical protein